MNSSRTRINTSSFSPTPPFIGSSTTSTKVEAALRRLSSRKKTPGLIPGRLLLLSGPLISYRAVGEHSRFYRVAAGRHPTVSRALGGCPRGAPPRTFFKPFFSPPPPGGETQF